MTVNEADAALTALAADLLEELSAGRALELVAGLAPPRSPDWRTLTPRQLSLAESANPDLPATPDRPGAHHCDICGCADSQQIEPGPDKEYFGADKCAWLCKDANARACESRKLHRYPPRPDLVPDAVLSAVGADDAGQAARAAAQQEPQSGKPAGEQSEPGQQEGWQTPEGWVTTANGSWNARGDWLPPLPAYQAYAHTLMNPAHRSHLLSGSARPHYYAGANYLPAAMYGAEPAQEAPGGQQGRPGRDPA